MPTRTALVLVICALSLHCGESAAANSPQREVILEKFTAPPALQQITISPDGKHFAAVYTQEGKERLAILNRETMHFVASMGFRGDEVVSQIRWANNHRVLVTNAVKLSRLDQMVSTGELYAVDVDGKNARNIFGYRAGESQVGSRIKRNQGVYGAQEILSLQTDDPEEILIQVEPWSRHDEGGMNYVARLNINNGRLRKVATAPVRDANYLADAKGNLRFAIGVNENSHTQVFLWNDTEKEWSNKLDSEQLFVPIGFDTLHGHAYWLSTENEDTLGIYRYDPDSGERTLVYRNERIDPRGQDLEFSPQGELLWLMIMDGLPATHYVNPEHPLSKTHKALSEAFPERLVEITSATSDGVELMLYVHGATDPGAYYLFNTKTKKAEFLSSPIAEVFPEDLANATPIRFKARDDHEVSGFVTRPKSGGKNFPMIVLIHGGPHQPGTEDRWQYNPEVQVLASQGYAVLQVNFRGSYGFGEKHLESGYRQWGRKMQDDVTDATRWAIEQGIADPKRICIYGASYGGYSAMMGLVTAPDLYQCGATYVGVSDLMLMHEEGDIPERRSGRNYLEKVIGSDEAELRKWSPAHRAADIVDPVLILHGGKDERVPIEHAYRLEKALKQAGKPVSTLYYPFETHGFFDRQHQIEAYRQLLDFFDQHTAIKP